jgi:hypothetical protein
LRADRKVAERVAPGTVARGLTALANGALRLRDAAKRSRSDCSIAAEVGPWGDEFTRAVAKWSSDTGTCVARTADYLNWRYLQHPHRRYEMLTARGGSKLQGYLIQHIEKGDCTIDDLMAEDDAVRCDLLAESIAVSRARGVETLSAPWLSSHHGRDLLRKCGFRPRESHPVVLLSWPGIASGDGWDKGQWFLAHGDWES